MYCTSKIAGQFSAYLFFRTPHELGVKKRRHQKVTKGGRKRVLYPDISLDTHFLKRKATLKVLHSVVLVRNFCKKNLKTFQ